MRRSAAGCTLTVALLAAGLLTALAGNVYVQNQIFTNYLLHFRLCYTDYQNITVHQWRELAPGQSTNLSTPYDLLFGYVPSFGQDIITASLMPSLNSGSNVFESSELYAVSKKSVASYNEPAAIESIVKSHQLESDCEMNGKARDYSNQCFALSNTNHDNIRVGERCSIAALKPARKQTAPRFLATINNTIVDVGRNVHFEAIIESYPAAEVTWYKNNRELSAEPGKIEIMWQLNRATLQLSNVDSSDAGRYTCSASNNVGSTSCSADLFVKKTAFPPVIGKRLHPQSVAVGSRVTFEIEVTGSPVPRVIWFKDDIQLTEVSLIYRMQEQGNSFSLIIEKARFEDSGYYKARASNEAGEAVSVATLHIFEPSKDVTDQGSIERRFEMTPGNYEISTTKSSELNNNYSGKFSKKIEVNKSNKRISFNMNGQKCEDDFSVEKNEYEYHSGNSTNPVTTIKEFIHKSTNPSVYENKSSNETYNFSSSNEIEELQKPIIYSNTSETCLSYPSNLSPTVYLEPGPPPELGYIPKEAVTPQKREPVAERVRKLQSCARELSSVEIPAGAVKIFPTIKSSKNNLEKKYSYCIKEYQNNVQRSNSIEQDQHSEFSVIQESPNLKVSEMETSKDYHSGPIFRPPADIKSPTDSVSIGKLQTLKNQTEKYTRPITPHRSIYSEENIKVSDLKRSLSPLPSADGVAMDKLWAHPIHLDKTKRPHSIIGGITDTVSTENKVSGTHTDLTPCSNMRTNYTSRRIYEDIHKVNDQVISETKMDETVTREGAEAMQKSFKCPPVCVDDSLVRKRISAVSPANFGSIPSLVKEQYSQRMEENVRNIEQDPQKYSPGVRSVPYPASKTLSSEKQEFYSNQTLPRSFKFASSSDSKFKPVKAGLVASIKQRPDSDYESDFEVTKISKQASAETASNSFATSNAVFSKDLPKKTFEGGYTAETDKPAHSNGCTFAPVSMYPRTTFSSSSYQSGEQSKTHTFPRISDKKVFHTLRDDTCISPRKATTIAPVPSPSKFVKCDHHESNYESKFNGRIPTIWRPSDSGSSELCYRPVRPNLQSTNQPLQYSASPSVPKLYDTKANFKPVSPAADFCASVKIKPSTTYSENRAKYEVDSDTVAARRGLYMRSHSGGGDSSWQRNETRKLESWPEAAASGLNNSYGQYSRAEFIDESSFADSSETTKVQKVEEIRKRFESCSGYSGDVSTTRAAPVATRGHNDLITAARFNADNLIPSNESRVVSDMTRSSEAEFIVMNGSAGNHITCSIPVFTTPLHDIAAVIGSLARFECIVQTDPPFTIEWRRNGEVVHDSELCQLSHRNGVCRLVLSKTYMYDAGVYQCIVTNPAGSVETSATLTVSSERHFYIKK